MSPTVRRRLRGFLGTMLTWGVAGSITGALMGAGISLGILWPRGLAPHFGELVAGIGFATGIVGVMAGFAFALIVTLSERRHTLAELKRWRMATWGALAAGVTGLLISRNPAFAVVCGVVGSGAATFSLAMAKRALGRAPAGPELLTS
jgi:hypothetical protein